MNNKDQKLLAEAYDVVSQFQNEQAKQLFFKNIFNKFMNESSNKTIQGFDSWYKTQINEKAVWANDEVYKKMHSDLQKKKIIPSCMEEFYKELSSFISQNIGADDRAWAVEA